MHIRNFILFWAGVLSLLVGPSFAIFATIKHTLWSSAPPTGQLVALAAKMNVPRAVHTSTLLRDGTILIAGGMSADGVVLDSSEIYDPATRQFTNAARLLTKRVGHTATLLPDGRVLIVGGFGSARLDSAELYDPVAKRFDLAGKMSMPRDGHTATLTDDGFVLITGGYSKNYDQPVQSAELYDPTTNRFTTVAPMSVPRGSHTATRLPDGRVLIVGGRTETGLTATAELYNPEARAFTPIGSLLMARHKHAAALLPNGDVLIVGGATVEQYGGEGQFSTVERYQFKSGTFIASQPMNEPRYKIFNSVISLRQGDVFIAGAGRSVELYDLAAGMLITVEGQVDAERYYASATELPNGDVLVLGGYDKRIEATNAAWVYH